MADTVSATQTPLTAQTMFPDPLSELPAYIDEVARAFKMPGVSVAVVRADVEDPQFFNWGKQSDAGDPSSEDTLYCIASNSKAFTATAMGILIDDFQNGRNVTPLPSGVSELTWTTKVAELLPDEWKLQDPVASSGASVIDLLSHVTGMPRHELSYAPGMSVEDLVGRMRYLRPTKEWRETYQYNNQMYNTVSYIISKYSKKSFPEFVKERIFDPLGMASSTYSPEQARGRGRLAQSWVNNAGLKYNETRMIPYFGILDWSDAALGLNKGAGGVISSTRELAQWVRAHLNEGKNLATGTQVIPKAVLDTTMVGRSVAETKGMFPEMSAQVYGAGWGRYAYQSHEIVLHGGDIPGFTSTIMMLPNDGVGMVVLSNGDDQSYAVQAICARIIEDLFELKHVDWLGRFLRIKQQELEKAQAVKPPSPAGFQGSLSAFAGTYAHPGYIGNLTLCAWPSTPGSPCEPLFSHYASIDPDFSTERSTTLYASWPRLWNSHFKLSFLDDTTAVLTIDKIYPRGYGNDPSPFVVRDYPGETKVVEFGMKEGKVVGMGMWGIRAGPREREVGEPERSAEVWFDKIA